MADDREITPEQRAAWDRYVRARRAARLPVAPEDEQDEDDR